MTQFREGASPDQLAEVPTVRFIAEVLCDPEWDIVDRYSHDQSHMFNDGLFTIRLTQPEECVIRNMAHIRAVIYGSRFFQHLLPGDRDELREFIDHATEALRQCTRIASLRMEGFTPKEGEPTKPEELL